MNRYQSTLALVVNKKTTKEQDISVTLLTPALGKILVLAKGAKNIKSRRMGALELGNLIKTSLYQKDGHYWLSEAQTSVSFLQQPKSLTQINLLFYFLEIINRLIAENQNQSEIFSISLDLIEAINHNKVITFISQEIKFLAVLGFGPPPEIIKSFNQKDYKTTQRLLRQYFASITEKKFESNKLFK